MEETITNDNEVYAKDYVDKKQMAETTKVKLEEFVKLDNLVEWDKMEHDDKMKFYDFIREAYAQGNIYVAWEEFLGAVQTSNTNLSEELIKDYFNKYQKGVELLLLSL